MKRIIFSVLTFFLMSCEEFQTETFSAPSTDVAAINALAADVSIPLSTVPISIYDSTWSNNGLDTIGVALYDSLELYDVLAAVLDTAYTIRFPASADTSYAAFSGGTSEIIIFIGEYIELNIVDGSGNIASPDDVPMELATVYESLNGPTSKDHYLKSRYVFKSLPQKAILQFIRTESTEKSAFKLIINQ